jgi:hypothetical protein
MEISKKESEALKKFIMKIGNGLFSDVDFFVNYNTIFPILVFMVDVDWDNIRQYKEHAYNYNLFLKKKFQEDIKMFSKVAGINMPSSIEFEILNWD